MDVFTPVSTTITTFSCRYCGGSHKGKSGREIHLKTQKHKDAVQKYKDTETLLALIEKSKHNTVIIDFHERELRQLKEENEEIQRQIIDISLKYT